MYCDFPRTFKEHTIPCRKCPGCNSWRQYQWTYRLIQEASTTQRTWFLTLTFRFTPKLTRLTRSFQLYMKRIRKENPSVILRYFAVSEIGSRGRLHLHALIFCSETSITRRKLDHHWKHGYSRLKLCRPSHIRYVCKYVTKDGIRILASQRLGYKAVPIRSSDKPHPSWYIQAFQHIQKNKKKNTSTTNFDGTEKAPTKIDTKSILANAKPPSGTPHSSSDR